VSARVRHRSQGYATGRPPWVLVAAAVVVLAALGLGFWLAPGPRADHGALSEEIASLRAALDSEVQERDRLEREIAELRERIDGRARSGVGPGAGRAPRPGTSEPVAATASEEAAPREAEADALVAGVAAPVPAPGGSDASAVEPPPPHADIPVWFDAGRLARLGLEQDDITYLRDRWEQYELDKLYVRDQAIRDGNVGSPTMRQEREAIELKIREDLGDEDYDLLLYASGQANRVQVGSVLSRSPGDEAGLQEGDLILSYAGVPVFRPRELRNVISQTPKGDLVWIEVERADGSHRDLRIPGGPIGIQLVPVSKTPAF